MSSMWCVQLFVSGIICLHYLAKSYNVKPVVPMVVLKFSFYFPSTIVAFWKEDLDLEWLLKCFIEGNAIGEPKTPTKNPTRNP